MPFRYQLFLLIHFTIHRTACGGNFQASDFVSHGRFAFFFFFLLRLLRFYLGRCIGFRR